MRIAILIGVVQYENCDNLPGCENDVNIIHDILQSSHEFDDIRIFQGNVQSGIIKDDLSNFFESYKGKTVDEVFFYFSGHGSFSNDEFFYILSDFNDYHKRQTSLQNSEIDNMIKSIKPKMVTKVIDACQSGISYIKGNSNIVEKYYSKTKDNFEKCYFLHSSMTSQYSYQNDDLSDFTKSFINSLNSTKQGSIRYNDIIAYIADEFERSPDQTPFFITQADHTEKFLTNSNEIKNTLSKYIEVEEVENDVSVKSEDVLYDSFIEKIKKDAEMYSSKEEVDLILNNIKNIITSRQLETELSQLFDYSSTFEQYLRDLPRGTLIAKWLEDNPNNYFAKPDYQRIEYQEEEAPSAFASISNILRGNKIVTKYRNELRGFTQSLDIPYKYLILDFVPKYPNIKQYALIITFLLSKKDIHFFYAFINYNEKDWNKKEIAKNFKWNSSEFQIKNVEKIEQFIDKLLIDTENKLLNLIKEKFDPGK